MTRRKAAGTVFHQPERQRVAIRARCGRAIAIVLVLASCGRSGPAPSKTLAAQIEVLIRDGRFDEALARLKGKDTAEGLYLQGRVWAAKAGGGDETARAEAIRLFESSLAAEPAQSGPHLGIAELLAEVVLEARGKSVAPPVEADAGRVSREFSAAIQVGPSAEEAARRWVEFALAAGLADDADRAFQETVRLAPRDGAVLVRYGDFLASRKDVEGARDRYEQALVLRPGDVEPRRKACRIDLDAARRHLSERQWSRAEARLARAAKNAPGGDSAESQEIERAFVELRRIRPSAGLR